MILQLDFGCQVIPRVFAAGQPVQFAVGLHFPFRHHSPSPFIADEFT